jgi:AGZA family xanthine/uracil permease-like MFS transporter
MVGILSEREITGARGRTTRTTGVNFANIEEGLPFVLTALTMPLTFNITNGIGVGFVSYVLIKVARGKWREVHPALYAVALAFVLYFLRWSLFDATF